jgi:PadR family transcriptional regulator PadR
MDSSRIIKGSLNIIILQLLLNNGKMYGYEIVKAVKDASKNKTIITEAALYPSLHKLEQEGKLKSKNVTVEGRVRKYYKLNATGRKEIAALSLELQETLVSLKKILKYKTK